MKGEREVKPAIGWCITFQWGNHDEIHTGWYLTRKEAIKHYCEDMDWSWEQCKKAGHRAIKVRIGKVSK